MASRALLLTLGALAWGSASSALAQPAETAQRFVGAGACASCHSGMHERWQGARHSKMLQPATPASVVGDFGKGTVTLRSDRYGLRVEAGQYYISESYLTGQRQEHRVDYTLGSRRIQHYLTTLPNGWIVVLPPSWDVTRREWFHNMEIVGPGQMDKTPVQLWNKHCFSCHVSRQEKNYRREEQAYRTAWQDFGTNCERCHGPGGRHVERYARKDPAGPNQADKRTDIVRPTRLDPEKSSMICAQCHSLREIMATGYTAGEDYYDYFLPLLEYGRKPGKDPVYWPDGRTRRFSNDAIGLWQSACFLKGKATCTTCHTDPHLPDVDRNPQLLPANNGLCLQCHDAIGRGLAAHTHHRPDGPGSSCVECHMPKTIYSIRASMRDHTLSLPAPENTVRFGIPNACNVCHADRKPQWAVEALDAWYPRGARAKLVKRAEAFTKARASDLGAIPQLVDLARDASEGPLVRANALGHLARYADSRVLPVLVEALRADHPLVRAVAAMNVTGPVVTDRTAATAALVEALRDERRVVRMSAALSLVNLGVARLAGEEGRRLEEAKRDYVARAELNADDAETQLDLGKFFLLDGRFPEAVDALRRSLRLDPDPGSARYFLALAHVGDNQPNEARGLLRQILPGDPYAEPARKLLAKLERRP